MSQDSKHQNDNISFEVPIQGKIIIPDGLEHIGGPNAGVGGDVFLDHKNKRAYRRLDFARCPTDKEANIADFYHKIEVSKRDSSGLTPHIYAYDPETYTLEMELIEGKNFCSSVQVTAGAAERFLKKLSQFHQLDLYHGDLFTREHWILTPAGEIRIIDPIEMFTDDPNSGNTVESIQAIDRGLAMERLREVGYVPPG